MSAPASTTSARPETRRQRLSRLLREVIAVGSPRQWRLAGRLLDVLEDGHRITPTTAGLIEALWIEATNHAVSVRNLSERPPSGTVWSWEWRHGHLIHDVWVPHELRPGGPIAALFNADGFRS